MTKEEKAKAIVNSITSYAPWGDWSGVTREEIERIIEAGLDGYAKQQAIDFANYVMNDYKASLRSGSPILTDEHIYNQFTETQTK